MNQGFGGNGRDLVSGEEKENRDPLEIVCPPGFDPLTEEDIRLLNLLDGKNGSTVLYSGNGLRLTVNDMRDLISADTMVDGDLIEFLLKLENGALAAGGPDTHVFSNLLYPLFSAGGYAAVDNLSAGVNVFEKKKTLFPIFINGNHWTLATLTARASNDFVIHFYDSGANAEANFTVVTKKLREFLLEEYSTKVGGADISIKPIRTANKMVKQESQDCAIFTILYGIHLLQRKPFRFENSHMEYFRKRFAVRILSAINYPNMFN